MLYERHQGGAALPKVECINPRAGKWLIRWDYQPHTNEEGEEDGITFIEHEFRHKPTLDEVKAVITEYINECIKKEIEEGFIWNQKPVWLSTEHQQDWKAAYDRALQTDGANLPLKFKIGEQEDGTPVYHTFTSVNAFGDFWAACLQHIHQCLADGWQMKDAMDWSVYECALDPTGQKP